jgi:hypothetical protein
MTTPPDDNKASASDPSSAKKKPTANGDAPNPARTYWKSIVTVLGSLQIAGVLAGSGFIVKFAREDFLGVSAGAWNVSDLGMLAGSFALTSATLFCQFVLRPLVAIPLIVLLAGYVLVETYLKRKHPNFAAALHVGAYVVIIVALGSVFRVEQAPTLYLHDFLITNPKEQPNISEQTPDYKATNNLVRLIFGSRIKDDPTRSTDFIVLQGFSLTTQKAYDVLNAQYARSILICLIGWNFLFTTERTARFKTHGAALVAVFVLLLLTVTTMIPYVYGKLIHSTDLPYATVDYKLPSPTTNGDATKHLEGPLLFQNDQTVAILWVKDGKWAVVYIPTSEVLVLRLHGTVDALTLVLGRQPLPKPLPPIT